MQTEAQTITPADAGILPEGHVETSAPAAGATPVSKNPPMPEATFNELMEKYPLAIGALSTPTVLNGTFFIHQTGLTGTGNHSFYTLREEGKPASPHRIQVLDSKENKDIFENGIRFVNPKVCRSQIPTGEPNQFKSTEPQGKVTQNGPLIYWTCYLLSADKVILPTSPMTGGSDAIKAAKAALAVAA